MTQGDVTTPLDYATPQPSPPPWHWRAVRWAEEMIARGVGLMFLWAGATKGWDGSKIHRVFAFDGVPDPFIVPLTHLVWIGEVILGLVLLIGVARRRAVVAAILVLFVYSVQIAYLIVANNPPEDCGCIALMAKYASAKQTLVLGLLRNAVLAACLEWVRLRIVGRALSLDRATKEDG